MNATEMSMRMNLRQRRAQVLAAHVMEKLRGHLYEDRDRDTLRDVHEILMQEFMAQGVEVLTDYDREQYGLPPRGPDGWTMEELLALERRRLEILTRPLAPMVIEVKKP
jgi:hypothetical protein